MRHIIHNRQLAQALIDQGLVPANCRVLDLRVWCDGGAVIVYETYLTAEDLPKLAAAFQAVADDWARSARPPTGSS